MRHQVSGRKFGRSPAHRRALFRSMATNLFLRERCLTTVPRAKELRRVVERLITLARADTLPARRQAYSYLTDKTAVHRLFKVIGPRYKTRPGGYTRIVRTGNRAGDAAEMAVIALVQEEYKAAKKKRARSPSVVSDQ